MKLRTLGAYLQERFALVSMGLLVVLFGTVRGGASVAGGALATVSFFFRLRVFDEEKDYALDALSHPQRVLQTGRVTLPQLRALAWAGTALELGCSAGQGRNTLALWALALGYSLLMRSGCRAVLIERGSALSHSVILLRELGIPTIINVPGLTQHLRSGQHVRLDGRTGTVEVMQR